MHYIYSSNKQNNPPKIELYQKLAHHLWYTAYNSLCAQSHTPQRQARTVLKTSTDNHFSSFHINCSGRAKPDIISTWWAFYFTLSGYEWPKGLITLAIASYGSDQLIGSFLANIEASYGLSTAVIQKVFVVLFCFVFVFSLLTFRKVTK